LSQQSLGPRKSESPISLSPESECQATSSGSYRREGLKVLGDVIDSGGKKKRKKAKDRPLVLDHNSIYGKEHRRK